jgi:lipopolysaccharide transport system ATP-binding protein
MFSETVIQVSHLSKYYQIYDQPKDRLKQFFLPRLKKLVGNKKIVNYYKEFRAIDDITFEVKKGETVGIIGRNGSGKSTLLQLICGTLNPSLGEVSTKGRIAALLELGSGFNPEFTGRENVYLNASLLGLSKAQIDAVYPEILAFAEIGDFIEQPIKTYSSGMLVRLAFAVIAHVNADILIIDEALAVGDVFFTQKCMRFIRKFMENGSILFVSHDTGAIINLCNKVVWLDHGKVISMGDPKTISEDYLASYYESTATHKSLKSIPVSTRNIDDSAQEDPRLPIINDSNLRNTLEVFKFDLETVSGFGTGRAIIKEVGLREMSGKKIFQTMGGEKVELYISIDALSNLNNPIVGFTFKDKLGQALFGDNTYLTYLSEDITLEAGQVFTAHFQFQMPIFPPGDYSVSVAIATGDQSNHQQEHWIHDALIIKSLSSSVSTGLIGIPIHKIYFDLNESS